jgi:hypothetical protein
MQQHCEPEDLALAALGEELDPACQEHWPSCALCAEQVAELREVVVAGKASGGPDALADPPAWLWDRIEEQLETEPLPLRPTTPAPAAQAPTRTRRTPGWLGLVAASAAGILVGGAVVGSLAGSDDPGAIVASTQLRPMPDGPDRGGSASATLNRADDGYTITVTASDLTGPEGFYEVWLLDEQDAGLIALGALPPGETEATFPVPEGVDLTSFSAVDISDEPLDGDPTHSTVTVLRGTLQT